MAEVSYNATYSSKCLIKSAGPAFKCNSQDVTNLQELQNGYLDFIVKYYWYDTNKCYLEIGWAPVYEDSGRVQQLPLSSQFSQTDKITFSVNGTNLAKAGIKLSNYYNSQNITIGTVDNVSIKAAAILDIETTKHIEINFKYEYTSGGKTYFVDLTENHKVKIFRPSRYDHNIVFNEDGLNELIYNIKQYPVISVEGGVDNTDKYGQIHITHGNSTKSNNIGVSGLENSTKEALVSSGHILPLISVLNLGAQGNEWNKLYASEVNGTNGNFINITTGGLNATGEISANSLNVNDGKFKVDSDGNIIMAGSINWGTNEPFLCVYHGIINNNPNERPQRPDNNTKPNNLNGWHKECQETDFWACISSDGGATWNTPIRINAKDGDKGDTGEWDADSIYTALTQLDDDGIFEFTEGANGHVTKIGIKATAILAELMGTNRLILEPSDISYRNSTVAGYSGGYISFLFPGPAIHFNIMGQDKEGNRIDKSFWRGRLGYLKGNGDGDNNTGGLGFAVYTDATFNDIQSHFNKPTTTSQDGNKVHLLLAEFILTQSGLGVIFSSNLAALGIDDWISNDSSTKPHYSRRWWSASIAGFDDACTSRLWLHEDNGGIYRFNGSQLESYYFKTKSSTPG